MGEEGYRAPRPQITAGMVLSRIFSKSGDRTSRRLRAAWIRWFATGSGHWPAYAEGDGNDGSRGIERGLAEARPSEAELSRMRER